MEDTVRGLNEDGLVLESDYADVMERVVLPYIEARQTVTTVRGDGDRPLYTVRYDADRPQGTVLMVHGFTENAYKYAELIHSLLRNGLSVVIYDQRGHGRSWRKEGIGDPSVTHVDAFDEYVRDLGAVADQALSACPKPWTLFSHSMGGAVSALYLESHPDAFARAAFCAPMIAPNRNGIPLPAAKLICRTAIMTGHILSPLIMTKPYSGPEDFDTSCASGRARFDWYDRVKAETALFRNSCPTNGWTLESLNVTARILADGAVERIRIPVRMYTAEHDGSVLPREQALFADRLPSGRRELVRGARHEIYRSADQTLFPWWHGVLAFLRTGGDV